MPYSLGGVAFYELYDLEACVGLGGLSSDGDRISAVILLGHDIGSGISLPVFSEEVVGAGKNEDVLSRLVLSSRLGGSCFGGLGSLSCGLSRGLGYRLGGLSGNNGCGLGSRCSGYFGLAGRNVSVQRAGSGIEGYNKITADKSGNSRAAEFGSGNVVSRELDVDDGLEQSALYGVNDHVGAVSLLGHIVGSVGSVVHGAEDIRFGEEAENVASAAHNGVNGSGYGLGSRLGGSRFGSGLGSGLSCRLGGSCFGGLGSGLGGSCFGSGLSCGLGGSCNGLAGRSGGLLLGSLCDHKLDPGCVGDVNNAVAVDVGNLQGHIPFFRLNLRHSDGCLCNIELYVGCVGDVHNAVAVDVAKDF